MILALLMGIGLTGIACAENNICSDIENIIRAEITAGKGRISVVGLPDVDRNAQGIWLKGIPDTEFVPPPHDRAVIADSIGLDGKSQNVYLDCDKELAYISERGGLLDTNHWYGPLSFETIKMRNFISK